MLYEPFLLLLETQTRKFLPNEQILPVSLLYFSTGFCSKQKGGGGRGIIRISVKYWEFLLLRSFESNRETEYASLYFPESLCCTQGVTKRCRLSWLTNSALGYEFKCWGMGGVGGPQPMSAAARTHKIHIRVQRGLVGCSVA
jgi:hypothetical protein